MDSLYELLVDDFTDSLKTPSAHDESTSEYLTRLSTLSVADLTSIEPQTLSHDLQSTHRSLQALSKRSYRSINAASGSLSNLKDTLPLAVSQTDHLHSIIPNLEQGAANFAQKYDRTRENQVLEARKKSIRLSEHVEQISDILELPILLSSIAASSNHANALDLYAYIKRLLRLYPNSPLIKSISSQSDEAMRKMTTNLIVSLQSHNLKLAGAMRLTGLLRRVAPDLDHELDSKGEGALGSVFLICRLSNLMSTLDALSPMKDLADQDKNQIERYLKRYIEVFREQSFAIISMYKNVFPMSLQPDGSERIPAALSTFAIHLVDMLNATLREYLPRVEKSSRDSLLMQVLYCANSLGRLGADFGMMLAFLDDNDDEWVEVVKKHRVQAGRLELLAIGAGARKEVVL